MKGKDILTSIASVFLLCLIRPSILEQLDQEELTTEQKNCMLGCLNCVEMWGTQYGGQMCARRCLESNGADIDPDCHLGVFVSKRYQELKATDECKKRCRVCSKNFPKEIYSGEKCTRTCEQTKGKVRDPTCTKHMTMFDMFAKYHFRQ